MYLSYVNLYLKFYARGGRQSVQTSEINGWTVLSVKTFVEKNSKEARNIHNFHNIVGVVGWTNARMTQLKLCV